MESLLSIKQAAEKLGVSHWYVSKQIRDKHLPVVRLSRNRTKIRTCDLDKFCCEHLERGTRVNAERVKQ